jgi:hypothetical protein
VLSPDTPSERVSVRSRRLQSTGSAPSQLTGGVTVCACKAIPSRFSGKAASIRWRGGILEPKRLRS